MTTLVIAAHPDDEVLGCGGTIARRTDEGEEVHIAILGEGVTSRYDDPSEADPAEIEALHADAQRAGKILGASSVQIFDFPDNRFDTVALLDIVKKIEEVVNAIEPETIYTQHGGDLNVDHKRTYRATLTATRPTPGNHRPREILAYEVPSSTDWSFQDFEPSFEPTVFTGISGSPLERKLEAMAAYGGEVRDYPHPRSPEALRAIAKNWGSTAGIPAAEAFELVRSIR